MKREKNKKYYIKDPKIYISNSAYYLSKFKNYKFFLEMLNDDDAFDLIKYILLFSSKIEFSTNDGNIIRIYFGDIEALVEKCKESKLKERILELCKIFKYNDQERSDSIRNFEVSNGITVGKIIDIFTSKSYEKEIEKSDLTDTKIDEVINNFPIKIKNIYSYNTNFLTYDISTEELERILCLSKEEVKNLKENLINFYSEIQDNQEIMEGITLSDFIKSISTEAKLKTILNKGTPFDIPKEELLEKLKNIFILEDEPFYIDRVQRLINLINDVNLYEQDDDVFISHKELCEDVVLNEELKNRILQEKIPSEFSKVQKIYYIYRRLCQIFTYDLIYWAKSYIDEKQQSKKTVDDQAQKLDISKFNEENTNLVCYQIALIINKFAEELGIDYCCVGYYGEPLEKSDFGEAHMLSLLKFDDFYIRADASYISPKGDMYYEKIEGRVDNFLIEAPSKEKYMEILSELEKVDKYIEDNDLYFKFNDSVSIIEKEQAIELSYEERLEIVEKILNGISIQNYEEYSYVKNIIKSVLGENFSMLFAAKKNTNLELVVILAYTPNKNKEDNIYYIIENNSFKKLTYKEMSEELKDFDFFRNSLPDFDIEEEHEEAEKSKTH